jgi:hypothetical protein
MLKVSLPNGVTVEGDSPQEVAEMLAMLGHSVAHSHGRGTSRRLPDKLASSLHTLYGWSPSEVARFLEGLPATTQAMLRLVIRMPSGVPTFILANELGLPDPKPIGSMLASIRRRAEMLGVPNPILSEPGEEARTVTLDQRDAAQHLLPQTPVSP